MPDRSPWVCHVADAGTSARPHVASAFVSGALAAVLIVPVVTESRAAKATWLDRKETWETLDSTAPERRAASRKDVTSTSYVGSDKSGGSAAYNNGGRWGPQSPFSGANALAPSASSTTSSEGDYRSPKSVLGSPPPSQAGRRRFESGRPLFEFVVIAAVRLVRGG